MQYKTLAVLAFSAGAIAAPEKRQLPSATYDTLSLLSVLQTGLPSSVLSQALADPSALYSNVASEFAAGSTPAWFTGLPSDVQTLLVPSVVATNSALLSSAAANATGILSAASSAVVANSTGAVGVAGNATALVPVPIATGNSSAISNSTTGGSGSNSTTGGSGSNSTSGRSSSLSGSSSTGSRTGSASSSSTGTSGSGSGSGSSSGAAGAGSTASSSAGASIPTSLYGFGLAGAVGLVGVLAL